MFHCGIMLKGKRLKNMVRKADVDHVIKLFIIKNPDIRKQCYIAEMFGVSERYICEMMSQLNISPRSKPDNCRG